MLGLEEPEGPEGFQAKLLKIYQVAFFSLETGFVRIQHHQKPPNPKIQEDEATGN
jgi:hypothetical protein